jgi:hypothetical protein
MSLNRYKNLRRYFHVSPLEPPIARKDAQKATEPLQLCLNNSLEEEDSLEEGVHWWWRLEPMSSTFCTVCQTCLIPGTEVAIDEIMVCFYSCLSDTCKMLNKPIKQGYKIFALANNSYV